MKAVSDAGSWLQRIEAVVERQRRVAPEGDADGLLVDDGPSSRSKTLSELPARRTRTRQDLPRRSTLQKGASCFSGREHTLRQQVGRRSETTGTQQMGVHINHFVKDILIEVAEMLPMTQRERTPTDELPVAAPNFPHDLEPVIRANPSRTGPAGLGRTQGSN